MTARCVDCIAEGITTNRPIESGSRKPRCATHSRAHKKRARFNAHGRTVEKTYGISQEGYWTLYEAQAGRCAICRVATGKVRRLAVDHDHQTGEVFGLACGPCNIMLGRLGRTADAYARVINYLYDPPARRTLGPTFVPAPVMTDKSPIPGIATETVAHDSNLRDDNISGGEVL